MSEEENEHQKEERVNALRALVEDNDAVFVVLVNYTNGECAELDMAVNASDEELFEIFSELFKNKGVRDEARKAVLYSDYGNKDADNLNLN
jgi:hypothetical protein